MTVRAFLRSWQGAALCLMLALVSVSDIAHADSLYGSPPKGRTSSNLSKSEYSVGARANRDRLPRNYQNHYLYDRQQYALSPFIVVNPAGQRPMILGPVRPYSDEEYSRLVMSTLNTATLEPAGSKLDNRTLITEVAAANGDKEYKRAETTIIDVLDRGILIADTREEIRLRGVRLLSERDPDEVMRFYARDAIKAIRGMTGTQTVTLDFQEPLRDRDGTVLAITTLPDGTNLNLAMLKQGYGRVEPKDFEDEADAAAYAAAERAAKDAKSGIWSKQ